MIYVDVRGRLGNQMFQYAFARTVQEETGQDICIQLQQNPKFGKLGTDGWENSLKYFKVNFFFEKQAYLPLWITKGSIRQLLSGFIVLINKRIFINVDNIDQAVNQQLKWLPFLNKRALFWMYNGYFNFNNFKSKHIFIKGTFESPKYFDKIKPQLLKEFEPVEPLMERNHNLYEDIISSESICVTIRSFKEIRHNKTSSNLYNVCSPEYFCKAIEQMKDLIPSARFFIFSDDIEWTKQNIDLSKYDVTYETDSNPIWEKLRLMYSCKHFIISNSTFSWWAQYLSKNNNKIVIAPKRWFNDNYSSPLLDPDWIMI